MSRLLNVAGVLLMLTTFIGRNFSRDDLFLRVGQLDAPGPARAYPVVPQADTMEPVRPAIACHFWPGLDRIFV